MMTCQLALAAALLAPAQGNKTVEIADNSTIMLGRVGSDRRPVDEQIEVMRALLLRKLGRFDRPAQFYNWTQANTQPGGASTATTAQNWRGAAANYVGTVNDYARYAPAAATLEGAYLDGYGAVFTVTTDAAQSDPRPKTDADKPNPGLTDWERTQRALRGEPVPEKSSTAAKEPPLGDVLLKLLAENGKHFTALKDDERVTLAVTFRRASQSALPIVTYHGQLALTGTAEYGQASTIEPKEDRVGTMTNLGDLHLKQGQPDRAIEAYTKAVELAEAEAKGSGKSDDQRVTATALKLANAYLAAGKEDEARAALDRAKAAREKPAATKTANKLSAAPLPGRLTVSATKKLLDQVGSGKMTMDEFRKQATVEYVPAGK